MKKTLLFLAALLIGSISAEHAIAQKKGSALARATIKTWGEGGTYNFNGQESDKPKNSSTNIGVGGEYFYKDNSSIGGFISYDNWNNASSGISSFEQKSSRIRLGPMASCFHPCGEDDNFGLRHTGNVYAGFGKDETTDQTNTQVDDVFDLGVRYKTGVFWRPSTNMIIGADFFEAGYQTTKKTSQASGGGEQRCNEWDIKVSPLNPSLSFSYLFSRDD